MFFVFGCFDWFFLNWILYVNFMQKKISNCCGFPVCKFMEEQQANCSGVCPVQTSFSGITSVLYIATELANWTDTFLRPPKPGDDAPSSTPTLFLGHVPLMPATSLTFKHHDIYSRMHTALTHTHTHLHTFAHKHTSTYICMYMCVCVYVYI